MNTSWRKRINAIETYISMAIIVSVVIMISIMLYRFGDNVYGMEKLDAPKTSKDPSVYETNELPEVYDIDDLYLIARIVMAEAEGEPELGKRLVIDTILNRVDSDRFPNTITEVIFAQNQFEPTWNGRLEKCYVKTDILNLVYEEIEHRTNYEVIFFNANGFNNWSRDLIVVGNHYFSGILTY